MGQYDFTYELPENFNGRIIQFLQQQMNSNVASAFQRCKYEYEDLGLAYYAGMRGDNWDKRALDFTIEGSENDINLLKSHTQLLESIIGKALKSNESGFLIKDIFFLVSDQNENVLPSSNEVRLNADIATANIVLGDLIGIGERVCLNALYNESSSENNINDYFRDMLFSKGYDETKDQTRHGISVSGKDAGEVDILLTKSGKEIAIFEGLKLNGINANRIDEHIEKAVNNYNSLGTATFIVVYFCGSNFEEFWKKYFNYIDNFKFNLEVKQVLKDLAYPNASTRAAMTILARDSYDFPVYFIVFKIC